MSIDTMLALLANALGQTILMVAVAGLCTLLCGIPLGFVLFSTRPGGLWPQRVLYITLSTVSNALRSIPFIILMVAIVPLTRWITGTSIGTAAAIVPLSLAAIPFFSRMVENVLHDIPKTLIEAAQAMGGSPWQIMRHVLWPEAMSGIIHAFTVTVIALIAYSAMAGAVGGGGLGDLGVRYGYQRFDAGMMLATVMLLILLVQCLQYVGDRLAKHMDKR
jgi:D-methionine transport system permease protein